MKNWRIRGIGWLTMMLILLLTACSGNSTDTTSDTGETDSATTSESQSENSSENNNQDEYVIKVFADSRVTTKVKYFSDTVIGKVVKEQFNIDFEFVPYPAGGDVKQSWNLMLAGGNYPEIIFASCNCLDTFKKYVQAGAVLSLDPYLDGMPNFKEIYQNSIPYWKQSAGDGKLYNWSINVPQDKYNWLESNDIAIRADILKEAGYPELLTPDQYVDLLADAIKKHPETNGSKTLGLVAPFGEEWGMAGIAPILYEKGYNVQIANNAVIWNQKDEVWEDMFTHPYTKESFQFFNKLYRAGALDEESFTDKAAQTAEKLKSGRALAAWYVTWDAVSSNNDLAQSGHPELSYIKLPIMPKGGVEKGEQNWTPIQETRPFDYVWITKNAKDPQRILELVVWATSDGGQTLLRSGIEGVHYTIQDGKRVPTEQYLNGPLEDPDYNIKQGFGLVVFLGNVMKNSPKDDQPYNMMSIPSIKDRNLNEVEKEVFAAMGWESSDDWWLKNAEAKPVGLAAGMIIDPTSSFGALETRLTDFRVKNTLKLFKAASDEEFERIYNELVEEYNKLNPQSLVDEYNRLYQEALAELEQYK